MLRTGAWRFACVCGLSLRAPSRDELVAVVQAHALLDHSVLLPRATVLEQLTEPPPGGDEPAVAPPWAGPPKGSTA